MVANLTPSRIGIPDLAREWLLLAPLVLTLGCGVGPDIGVNDTDIEFSLPPGFQLETVAAEPNIRQPVYLTFDERGRIWVVQYLQFPFPKGLQVVDHDQYWRVQYDHFPPPAPSHHVKGADRVTILEDTNGDGTFDKQKDFLTGLNIVSAALPGGGGVWVLNPPYLLFYPDRDRDDVPDGDPEVHLEGFGLEDLHSVASSLLWDPRWLALRLYGEHHHSDGQASRVGPGGPAFHGAVDLAITPREKAF